MTCAALAKVAARASALSARASTIHPRSGTRCASILRRSRGNDRVAISCVIPTGRVACAEGGSYRRLLGVRFEAEASSLSHLNRLDYASIREDVLSGKIVR